MTRTVNDDPHWELNVTSNGPRRLLLETIEKPAPVVETVCEVGETVKLDGKLASTKLEVLMLIVTLPVAPPFFLIEILDVEALI